MCCFPPSHKTAPFGQTASNDGASLKCSVATFSNSCSLARCESSDHFRGKHAKLVNWHFLAVPVISVLRSAPSVASLCL